MTLAYSFPPFPIIISNLRQSTAAALAAIALTLTPTQPPQPCAPPTPAYQVFTPSPSHRIPYATAPTPPVVVFDKDYATRTPSIWQFQTEPEPQQRQQPPPQLPPRPLLSSEIRILTRLLVALVVGGIIGMERRAANSLAGVRTFSLVSLGAAIFMSTTLVAFPKADPTRVAAAISSGVGFLGAGAMHKDTTKHSRGLTTASSVWLAAALGIAAACGMFLLSFMGAISTVLIARYARFDSSLHLIRGDPLGDLDDFADEAEFSQELAYKQNGFELRGSGFGKDARFGNDVYELQSMVDFDPSSQTGYSEWRASGGNDASRSAQNGSVNDGNNQVEER